MNDLYYFWKAPVQGLPEASGYGVTIIPGLDQWVLLHKNVGIIPPGAIPASRVREFLEKELDYA